MTGFVRHSYAVVLSGSDVSAKVALAGGDDSEREDVMVFRVLVIDDDPDIARLEQRILQHGGYLVTVAGDDHSAGAAPGQPAPDLILTNVRMLRQHEGKLRADLIANGATSPAVLVSASDDVGPSGVPFLRRPFAMRDLLQAVAAVLAAPD